jgi:inner membrane protease subunit 2
VISQRKFEAGSVYVLKSPSEPDKLLVKRLLALSGSPFRVHIPTGHAWIRGDNRIASQDSQTQWGAVPLGLFKVMHAAQRVENNLARGSMIT